MNDVLGAPDIPPLGVTAALAAFHRFPQSSHVGFAFRECVDDLQTDFLSYSSILGYRSFAENIRRVRHLGW